MSYCYITQLSQAYCWNKKANEIYNDIYKELIIHKLIYDDGSQDNDYFFKKFIYLIYLFLAVLGLRWCAQPFSSCRERGATLCCGARASHCGGFSCCGVWTLGTWASVVVADGF